LTEGLTQVVLATGAMLVPQTPFAFYIACYRTLGEALQVEAEQLWRALWEYLVGGVRDAFVSTIAALRDAADKGTLNARQRTRLLASGDTLFRTQRANDAPNPSAIPMVWRAALR
jgi:hypothetical protein